MQFSNDNTACLSLLPNMLKVQQGMPESYTQEG